MRNARLTREEAKLVTRSRLIEAALGILASNGQRQLTPSQVAREAGVAQPTFYVHFRDRDDLLQAIGQARMSELRAAFKRDRSAINPAALVSGTATEARIEALRSPLRAIQERPVLFRAYVQERMHTDTPLGRLCVQIANEIRRDLIEDLAAMAASADIAIEPARLAMIADGFIGLIESLALGLMDGRYEDEDEAIAILLSFTNGVLTQSAASPGMPDGAAGTAAGAPAGRNRLARTSATRSN